MRPWSRVDAAVFLEQPLRAHAVLHDVPIHDVWRVDLPSGGPGRSMADVRSLMARHASSNLSPVVRMLFGIRIALGRLFQWDEPREPLGAASFYHRLTADDLAGSTVAPGTREGPFVVLYVHEHEALSEARNATVHAFSVFSLVEQEWGYHLFWAIYVRPGGGLTQAYMALIDPFRRWIVYPSLLRRLHRAWTDEYGAVS